MAESGGDVPRVVHFARDVSTNGGVASVVNSLHEGMKRAAIDSSCRTGKLARFLRGHWPRGIPLRKFAHAFGLIGHMVESFFWRTPQGAVSISHGDDLTADVLVLHSCHKAFLRRRFSTGYYLPLLDPGTYAMGLRGVLRDYFFRPRFIVSVSPATLDDMMREHPRLRGIPSRVILNGVDLPRFAKSTSSNHAAAWAREDLGLAREDFVMVLVATRFASKGVDVAIRSLPMLPPHVHLVVVGGGEDGMYRAQAAKEGVSERVHFVGTALPDPYYHAADCFVLPTEYEAFGLVGVEALACGLPILMTNTGGIPTYLTDGGNGYFIASSDDIALRVQGWLDDPSLHERMSADALRSAAPHSWDTRVREYIEVVREVADRKAGR